ncbi:hypothetical protein F2Q70_00022147 [Brassica cretica]|uniref:Uncharacterized protein n=1 Tax=Brassica cretica TaxID=69181 RepID=A0A8S9GMN3_BRACR|nr:hypothetical protein F2Q70_00022147 [Brassica cretica]
MVTRKLPARKMRGKEVSAQGGVAEKDRNRISKRTGMANRNKETKSKTLEEGSVWLRSLLFRIAIGNHHKSSSSMEEEKAREDVFGDIEEDDRSKTLEEGSVWLRLLLFRIAFGNHHKSSSSMEEEKAREDVFGDIEEVMG